MKMLLVCLVLLGCTVSHVSTSGEQTHLMKRLLRALEDEREENIENESQYLKCTQYVRLFTSVFAHLSETFSAPIIS